MGKIICDICGTAYQDAAEQCPICGCTRGAADSLLGEDILAEELVEEPKGKIGKSSSKKKEIFDFDEANSVMKDEEVVEESFDQDEDDDDDEEYEDAPRSNTFVIVLLTILIVVLMAVAGFLFFRYFLPNMSPEETVPTTAVQVVETTAPTTQPGIPCQSLVLTSGTAELTAEGQYFLLNVIAMPEDTTDKIMYASADESIATVTEDGKITAISEGETVIYITCGNSQLPCPVVCKFVEETEPPTEATTVVTEPEETVPETTVATEPAVDPNVKLKLKKTDIGLKVYYYVTLELDCELAPTDVEWSSEHPHIASVDANGVVTAKKDGVTDIIAKYGNQEVRCKVRCSY